MQQQVASKEAREGSQGNVRYGSRQGGILQDFRLMGEGMSSTKALGMSS